VLSLAWLNAGYVLHWPHCEPSLAGPTVSVVWLLGEPRLLIRRAMMLLLEVLVFWLLSAYLAVVCCWSIHGYSPYSPTLRQQLSLFRLQCYVVHVI
jgi:hypothetical protein